jgi:hypothetical protein
MCERDAGVEGEGQVPIAVVGAGAAVEVDVRLLLVERRTGLEELAWSSCDSVWVEGDSLIDDDDVDFAEEFLLGRALYCRVRSSIRCGRRSAFQKLQASEESTCYGQ